MNYMSGRIRLLLHLDNSSATFGLGLFVLIPHHFVTAPCHLQEDFSIVFQRPVHAWSLLSPVLTVCVQH